MVPEDVRLGARELTPAETSPERPASLRTRFTLALALSLAVHEILAMLWPLGRPQPPPPRTVAEVVTISRRTPRPTPSPRPTPFPHPRPTPTPPPQTPPPHPSFAPHVVRRDPAKAAILPRRKRSGGRAAHRIVRASPRPVVAWVPVAIQTADAAGVANGGAGTGAGAGTGDSGLGGTGAGVSGAGNGNGGDTNAAPCGSVDFFPLHTQTARDGSQEITVEMDVTLRAGTVERDTLGWRWHYASEAANPFDAKNGDGGIAMQLPPPQYDVSQLKPAVAYAIRHTSPEGILAFEPCPP